MSGDLPTARGYKAIVEAIAIGGDDVSDGVARPAVSGETAPTTNPATGAELARVAACGGADGDLAAREARPAFEDGRWRHRPPAERKRVLVAFAGLIERDRHKLAALESLDGGKPVAGRRTTDVPETANTIRWHAEPSGKLYDDVAPVGRPASASAVREPIGVVGCVSPWDFAPLMMAWKIGPALAAGCSVIVKPAEAPPLTAPCLAELALEAGVPAGVLNVVPGGGLEVGGAIGLHPDGDMVGFTGSAATGKRFLRYAAAPDMERVVLECGGKNPAVVFDGAEDLDPVAEQVALGAFWNMGENCSATSRPIVHETVEDDLLGRMKADMREWRMGDSLDPGHQVGALVSRERFEKAKSYIGEVSTGGFDVAGGGKTRGGASVEPTVADGVTSGSGSFEDESFGPVLTVTTFTDVAETVAPSNGTRCSLTASVYTGNFKRALEVARESRAGTATVNRFGGGDITTPFGGFEESGFGGCDESVFAHDRHTESKTVWIATPDRSTDGTVW